MLCSLAGRIGGPSRGVPGLSASALSCASCTFSRNASSAASSPSAADALAEPSSGMESPDACPWKRRTRSSTEFLRTGAPASPAATTALQAKLTEMDLDADGLNARIERVLADTTD